MKKSNAPANKGNQLVSFTLQDARRINAAVLNSEKARRGRNSSVLPRAAGGGGGSSLVMGTFTGAWPVGGGKIVTVGSGTAAYTVSAMNNFSGVLPSVKGSRRCWLSPADGDSYELVNAEC